MSDEELFREVDCSECGGKGSIPTDLGDNVPCSNCASTGKVPA